MSNLPLGRGAYDRPSGRMPTIECFNRFFEENPTNVENGVALLSRPGTEYFNTFGAGPIRQMYAQRGTFDGALFVISDDKLFRHDDDGTTTAINGTILGSGTPAVAGTSQYLFIADGAQLLFYDGIGSRATGLLTLTTNATDGSTVVLNGVTYTFKTAMTTAFDVQLGATAEASLDNLRAAVVADPEEVNIAFFVGTTANPFIAADFPRADGANWTLPLHALVSGPAGNAYTTTTTIAGATFDDPTLTGGVADGLSGIQTPDDVGFVSLAVLEGYVLALVSNSQRIYFIRPGETSIDPLDFFEAEAIPDHGVSLRTVGDLVWCFGEQSSDAFYLSGANPDVPFARFQGRSFSKGILPGTDGVIDNSVLVVGNDDIVYEITPGGSTRMSNHGIENLIRRARKIERDAS